jgi:glucose-1-phosphatase
MHPLRVILFDLGGVLIRLRGPRALLPHLKEPLTEKAFLDRWLHEDTVRAFESGKITLPEFCERLPRSMGLSLEPDAFAQVFLSFLDAPYPGTATILPRLAGQYRVGVLSNTSGAHWETALSMLPALESVQHAFLSFRMGLLKPDRSIFQEVIRQLELPAEHILYFDDHAANVNAARSLGIQGVLVDGFMEAAESMVALGLLEPELL